MLSLTRRHASHTSCLGIANDLPSGFGISLLASSQGFAPVDRLDIPGEPAPSLHPHPSEQVLLSYYGPVRQRAPRPVLSAYGFCLGTLPLATLGAYDPGRLFRRSPSHVPCKSRRPGSRRLYAGHRLASNAGSRQAHPKDRSAPRFRCHLNRFRRLNDDARLEHAARTGRFLERLPGPHLARSTPRLLPERSPRQSSANAAPGWFDAYPRGADAGGPAILHLSHSTAFQKTVPTSASFCVRDTRTSRFSRMESSRTCIGSPTARGPPTARDSAAGGVAFRLRRRRRHPETVISRLNSPPARTPVNASPAPSRTPTHGSGPSWFATPSM